MRKDLKNNQIYYDSMQGVSDHKNTLGSQRAPAIPLVNGMENEVSVGSLFSFKPQMLGLNLVSLQCHPVLKDEKVEKEGKRVLDRKELSSNLAYLEEWQGS